MMLSKLSLTVVTGLLLSGCATQNANLEMSSKEYSTHLFILNSTIYCGISGMNSPEITSLGIKYSEDNLGRYGYSSSKIRNDLANIKDSLRSPSKEECNAMAIAINQRKNELGTPGIQGGSPNSGYTFCNRMGTQTMCSTF